MNEKVLKHKVVSWAPLSSGLKKLGLVWIRLGKTQVLSCHMLLHLAKCVVMTILQDWKHGSAISRRQVLTIICPRHIEAQGTAVHLDSPKIQMIGTTVGLRLGDFKMDFFHRGASCSTLSLLYGRIRNKNLKSTSFKNTTNDTLVQCKALKGRS